MSSKRTASSVLKSELKRLRRFEDKILEELQQTQEKQHENAKHEEPIADNKQFNITFERAGGPDANMLLRVTDIESGTSIPIVTLTLDVIPTDVTPQEFAETVVATGYAQAVQHFAQSNAPEHLRPSSDNVSVILEIPGHNPVFSASAPADVASAQLLETVQKLVQSDEDFEINQAMRVMIQVEIEPRGATTRFKNADLEKYYQRGIIPNLTPLLTADLGVCMLLAVVTNNVREINMETGEVNILPYLPMDDPKYGNAMCAFYPEQQLLFLQFASHWDTITTAARYLALDIQARRQQPEKPVHMFVEADLEDIALFLGVCIHIHCYEAGGMLIAKYGDPASCRHMYILKTHMHYLPVWKIHRYLYGDKDARAHTYCDFCGKNHGKSVHLGNKKQKCRLEATKSVEGSLAIRFQKLQDQRNQPWFTLQTNTRKKRQALYCLDCNCWLEDTHISPSIEEEIEEDIYDLGQGEHSNHICCKLSVAMCHRCKEHIPVGRYAFHNMNPGIALQVKRSLEQLHETRDIQLYDKYHWLNAHRCYCATPELKMGKTSDYFVWDMESFTVPVQQEDGSVLYEHKPYFIAMCNLLDATDRQEFEGEKCLGNFCRHIFETARYRKCVFLAHNGGGYDNQFVARWLEKHGMAYKSIPSPTSIHRFLEIECNQVILRDTFNFINIPLAKFGKTFGLPQSKGDFPHRFSKYEHLHYEGSMPSWTDENDWYGLASIRGETLEETEKARTKRMAELQAESELYWDPVLRPTFRKWKFLEQMKNYCWQDVEVLRLGCMAYRDLFVHVSNIDEDDEWKPLPVDPFQYLTQPQVLQKWMLAGAKNLKIAAIPYVPKTSQSVKALAWLMSEQTLIDLRYPGVQIQHAYNSYKEYIGPLGNPVDGYAYVPGRTSYHSRHYYYQFHGCYWHGCPTCFDPAKIHPHYKVPFSEVYRDTLEKDQLLKDRAQVPKPDGHYRLNHPYGIKIVKIIWEHEWDDRAPLDFHYEHATKLSNVMTDRDAFFGGHVNVFHPMVRANVMKDEKIRYIDITSHYPNICANYTLCTGHPTRYLGNQIELDRFSLDHFDPYFGFFRGIISPNKSDMYGGLPYRNKDGTVIFDNVEREYCGFIEELRERLQHGARIVEIYEVLHFPPSERHLGPFRGYIAYNYRDKMEASGWSSMTDRSEQELSNADKEEICDQMAIENKNLCRPRPQFVEDNPGRRFLAKLRVNSLWGKYVQQDVSEDMIFLRNYSEYLEFRTDLRVDKSSVKYRHLQGDMFQARFNFTEEFYRRSSNVNPYLGASVTGWARTLLHKKIRETEASYCDTDSVIYLHKPGIHPEKWDDEGTGLGQWSDELNPGERGLTLYALSPKSYCFVYLDAKGCLKNKLKCKGITMTHQNHAVINRQNYERLLCEAVCQKKDYTDDVLEVQANVFQIVLNHHSNNIKEMHVVSREGLKQLQCVFNKRELVPLLLDGLAEPYLSPELLLPVEVFPQIWTLPFGYESVLHGVDGYSREQFYYSKACTYMVENTFQEIIFEGAEKEQEREQEMEQYGSVVFSCLENDAELLLAIRECLGEEDAL